MMTIRQAVVFTILMQNNEGILGKHPSYLLEKLQSCSSLQVPEVLLDSENLSLFQEYVKKFKFKWNKNDSWEVPIGSFNPVTGEAK